MKPEDKRKQTSRLNALKSIGPKTPKGKQVSSLNASTHGAYARSIVLPGESVDDYEAMVEARFHQFNPDNHPARCLVSQMAITLWRLNRIAPAEAYMLRIQLDRMEPAIRIEFDDIPAAGLYALGVSSLESQGSAQAQLLGQERRLLTQYRRLRELLLSLPQMPPPPTPVLADFQSGSVTFVFGPPCTTQPDPTAQEPVETKLTATAAHSQTGQPFSQIPVETNLTGSAAAMSPIPVETNLNTRNQPHSFLPVTKHPKLITGSFQTPCTQPIPLGMSVATSPMLISIHEEEYKNRQSAPPAHHAGGS